MKPSHVRCSALLIVWLFHLGFAQPVQPGKQPKAWSERLSQERFLTRPLVWLGEHPPTEAESVKLWEAGQSFKTQGPQALEGWLVAAPESGWRAAVLNQQAAFSRQQGRYSKALRQWEEAWKLTRSYPEGAGKRLGDEVLCNWMQLLSSLGRIESLADLLEHTRGRQFEDGYQSMYNNAVGALAMMREHPGLTFRCGTFALFRVASVLKIENEEVHRLTSLDSPTNGFSMSQLLDLAARGKFNLMAVERPPGSPFVVPSVVHWRENHYAAIVRQQGDSYEVIDPTFGRAQWMHASVLEEEASGKYLVPADRVPAGWQRLSREVTDQVRGMGLKADIYDYMDWGKDGQHTPCEGMPAWWVSEPFMNLFVADEPLAYNTSRGRLAFRLTYKQRDSLSLYPDPMWDGYFTSAAFPPYPTIPQMTDARWSLTFKDAIICFRDPQYDTDYWYRRISPYARGVEVTQLLETGGVSFSTIPAMGFANTSTQLDRRSKQRISTRSGGVLNVVNNPQYANGAIWDAPASTTGFVVNFPDGSQDVYGYIPYGPAFSPFKAFSQSGGMAFLTQRIDPQGQVTTIGYVWLDPDDPANNPMVNPDVLLPPRIKYVVDCDGRTNTFTYHATFHDKVATISSPFGKITTFGYNQSGLLTNIMDSASMSSSVVYAGPNGYLKELRTPYGTNAFKFYTAPDISAGNMGGHNRINRAVQVVEPNGGNQLFVYRAETASVPDSYQWSAVPTGTLSVGGINLPLGSFLDNGVAGQLDTYGRPVANPSATAGLRMRNSFHWGRKQTASLSIVDLGANLEMLPNLTDTDYLKARMRHWLEDAPQYLPQADPNLFVVVSDRISMERLPSPDGVNAGAVTWWGYGGRYPGTSHQSGPEALPQVVARVLGDGSTQFSYTEYNGNGLPTRLVSTYSKTNSTEVGTREWNYTYAPNGINLIKVTGPGGISDVRLTAEYNGTYQPTKIVDAVSNTTLFSYSQGYLFGITYPSGLYRQIQRYFSTATPSWRPYTDFEKRNAGYISSITDTQLGGTHSFTYTNGNVFSYTDTRGLIRTNTWDGLDRLTSTTFADASVISNQYTRLDLTAFRDQAGNWTTNGYNRMGQLTAVTNARSFATLFGYCTCGAMTSVTNTVGGQTLVTSYDYDLQLRRTRVTLPSADFWVYQYDKWGWLTNMTDGAGRSFTFGYNNQGLLTSASNAFGQIMRVVYDREDRPTQISDSNGAITYRTYDAGGRLTAVTYTNGVESYVYTNNLLAFHTNQEGKVTRFGYDRAARLVAVTNANNEVTRFTWNSAGDLLRLTDARTNTTIWNYDAFGRVTNKVDSANRKIWDLTYYSNGLLASKTVPGVGTNLYGYDAVGNLTSLTRADIGFSYTYDELNRLMTMTDPLSFDGSWFNPPPVAGRRITGMEQGYTRFAYTPDSLLTSEGGLWGNDRIAYAYAQGLRTNLGVGIQVATISRGVFATNDAWSQAYTYDAARRLNATISSAGVFTNAYSLPLNQPNRISYPGGAYVTNVFDVMGRWQETTLRGSTNQLLGYHGYQFNRLNRATNQVRLTSCVFTYQYDNIGQLTNATGKEANGTVRLHEKFSYAYDAAGNLINRSNNASGQRFLVAGNLNEINSTTRAGTYTVSGMVVGATNLTVNGLPATLYSDGSFARDIGLPTTGVNTFTVVATGGGRSVTNWVQAYLPATTSFANDARGNLLNDVGPQLSYDADDRLVSMKVLPTSTTPGWETDYIYDGLGRLRIRTEYTLSLASTGVQVKTPTDKVRYLYDGFTVVQERDGNNNVLATYTRGNDLSGTRQGAGGIGGLLARTDGTGSSLYYHADRAGNVTTLFDASQAVVGRYAYDPFGRELGRAGSLADVNRYRFSSKEVHPQSGMYNYGFRFYQPNLQRWTSRDPIAELGGVNLYGFVTNDPVDGVDPLGWSDFNRSPNALFGPGNAQYGFPALEPMVNGSSTPPNLLFSGLHVAGFALGKLDQGVAAVDDFLKGKNPLAKSLWNAAQIWQAVSGIESIAGGLRNAGKGLVPCTSAAKNAPVIIGENMNRVNAYAGKVGGETIDGWLAGRKWTQQLNDEFISTMKAQGRQFQDIGPDFGRRLQNRIDPSLGRPPSSVYGGERQSLLDYGNYQRLYDRTGKYQGGVPGLDP